MVQLVGTENKFQALGKKNCKSFETTIARLCGERMALKWCDKQVVTILSTLYKVTVIEAEDRNYKTKSKPVSL